MNDETGLMKVSAIQTRLKRFDREYNIKRNLELIEKEAVHERPHIICIPNYFFQTGLEEIGGPAVKSIVRAAVRYDVYIIGGMAEADGDAFGYNTGFIASPDGSVRALQRKIHLITMEKKKLRGGSDCSVIDLPFARVGCVMCNDIFYPEVARCLALQGVEIIFCPSVIGGLGIRGMETVIRARAVENQVYMVNANGIPLEASEEYPDLEMGNSGIYGPFLNEIDIARAGTGEETIRAILDLDDLRELKSTPELDATNHGELALGKSFNLLAGRRPEVYARITKMEVGR